MQVDQLDGTSRNFGAQEESCGMPNILDSPIPADLDGDSQMPRNSFKNSPRSNNSVSWGFSIRSRKIQKADRFLFEEFEDEVAGEDILQGVDIPAVKEEFRSGKMDLTNR